MQKIYTLVASIIFIVAGIWGLVGDVVATWLCIVAIVIGAIGVVIGLLGDEEESEE